MNKGILCSFYGKSDDICDVGCGYISSSDVTMIIKYCSSNYRGCSKYQELTDRFPVEISRDKSSGKRLPTPAGAVQVQRPVVSGQPLIKPFHINWPLPFMWRRISTNVFREHRPFAGGFVEPITSLQRGRVRSAEILSNATADPAPLGLLGFGMAIVLVALANAGLMQNAFLLAMGIFCGGFVQIITGISEWRRNNTFGATAFISYGMFWLTLVALMVMPRFGLGLAPSSAAVVAYLSMWGIFTAALFIGTLKLGRTLQVFFGLLTMLFLLLAISGVTGSDTVRVIAGYQGIITGAMAIYAGMAKVVKDLYQSKPMTV